MSDIAHLKNQATSQMDDAIKAFQRHLSGLRTGRATPALLEPITVEAYGGKTPLAQLGSISAVDARMLAVQVWDASVVPSVEKALRTANFNPIIEGTQFRIPLPELSHERRQELVKQAKKYAEETKVGLRNVRRSVLEELPKDWPEDSVYQAKKDVDKLVSDFSTKVDDLLAQKESEILRV